MADNVVGRAAIEIAASFEQAIKDSKTASDKIASNLKDAGKSVSSVGGTLSKTFTVPLTAIATASTAAFKEVDAGMDTIVTKTGASGQALEDMQGIMKNIATEIPTDFSTASNAVGEVSTRFKVTGDQLHDLSTQFIEFASINNTDVTTSVANAQQIISSFGMSVDDTSGLLGLMTSVSQNTGVSVDELAANVQANGSTFRDLGFNASQATVLLGDFEAEGVNSETALMGMKKAAVYFQQSGVDVKTGLQDLIGKLSDGTVSTEDYKEAVTVMGSKAADAFVDMASNGKLSLDDLNASLGDYGTTVSDTFTGTLDPADNMTTALNSMKEAGADLGDTLGATLAPMMQTVAGWLQQFDTWWKTLDPETQQTIITIALILGVMGPVLIVIGQLISSLALLAPAFAILTGPIGLVIAAMALAAIAGAELAKHWDEVKTFFQTSWENIKTTFQNGVNAVVNFFPNLWQKAKSTAQSMWNAFTSTDWGGVGRNIIQGMINGIGQMAGNLWNAAVGAVKNAYNAAKSWLGIKSPSKKFAFLGQMSVKGMGEGFEDETPTLTQTVSRNIKDVYSDALPTAGKLTPSLDFTGVSDLLGAQTSSAISQGIDTAAIAAAVKSGAEAANLSAYFNADKVADSTTAKTNVNMNIITKRNARYGQ